MELKHFERVTERKFLDQIYELLSMYDREFIPPLSSRSSTTQANLDGSGQAGAGVRDYFDIMAQQDMVLALEGETVAGFMAFRRDHTCEHITRVPNLYASTCLIHPDFRGQKLMQRFYETMMAAFPGRPIYTRTWHTNYPHLRVLDKLGFRQLCCLENHRGQGIHTVYYGRE